MIPKAVRIFVCTEPQDMRGSFDRLALIVRQQLGEDPQSGAMFVFTNRRSNRLKAMWWEENGYCMLYKRLHRALFHLPPRGDPSKIAVRVDGRQLGELLRGVVRTRRRRRT